MVKRVSDRIVRSNCQAEAPSRTIGKPMDLEMVYGDDQLIVVSKPPGMLSQANHTGDPDVLTLMKARLRADESGPGTPYLGLVHRLDRPASGLMVLARTSEAARHLSAQFREHFVDKRYLALVEGMIRGLGTCVDYLVKADRTVRVVPPDHPEGKRAELSWQSVAQSAGRSLLQVQLKTGRSHQIRVQLAERGHPLLGDFRYGAQEELDGRNLALHSYGLALEHPTRHRGMRWTAPPPAAWEPVLDESLRAAVHRLLAAASPSSD